MNNFNVTSSVVYDYTIMPLQAGIHNPAANNSRGQHHCGHLN
jgi:hypothetical protein